MFGPLLHALLYLLQFDDIGIEFGSRLVFAIEYLFFLFHSFVGCHCFLVGFGPGFGFPSRAFFSSASISFRSDFETRRTLRSALWNSAALGRDSLGLAIFCGYNTPLSGMELDDPLLSVCEGNRQ